MSKGLIFVLVISILAVIGILLSRTIGDIRPAILPSKPIPSQISGTTNITPANLPLNLPQGFILGIFAQNLEGVRDLEFSPEGILLASVPSSGKVIALPNSNGKSVQVQDILTGLNNPHGIAFFENKLFVAEENKVIRYNWNGQNLQASQDKVLFNIPGGGRHSTKSIVFDSAGNLYLSIGSTCDVCVEKDERLAAVLVSDKEGNNPKVFAKGLRNAVFIALNPQTQEVWGTEMGRDFLGDNAPPDEINIIREGKDYGWPFCYGNKIADNSFTRRSLGGSDCENTESPIFEIPAHSAPLGLAFINSPQFPQDWHGDLLVAYHGSWNRSVPVGYKVVRMDVEGNKIVGEEDFISGFLQDSQTLGRPVDLIFDKVGNLYISDDKAEAVYILGKR